VTFKRKNMIEKRHKNLQKNNMAKIKKIFCSGKKKYFTGVQMNSTKSIPQPALSIRNDAMPLMVWGV